MASLLGLPREIRDEILRLVLCSRREPPDEQGDTSSLNSHDNSGASYADFHCRSWSTGGLVRHHADSSTVKPNASGILLANLQLRTETLKLALGSLNYSLDMFLLNEEKLLPTWTCVPLLSQQTESVTATLRYNGYSSGPRSGFRGGNGGPPRIVWAFYILLERFVKVGPVGPMTVEVFHNEEAVRKAVDHNISVKTLRVDVRTPDKLPRGCKMNPWPPTAESLQRRRRVRNCGAHTNPEEHWMMHPEEVLDFLQSYMDALLSMNYHTAAFGALFYERVGTIEIKLDGKMRREWNLAQMLADFPREGSYQSFQNGRQAHFPTWKQQALDKRQSNGLPVIWSQAGAK